MYKIHIYMNKNKRMLLYSINQRMNHKKNWTGSKKLDLYLCKINLVEPMGGF